MAFSFARTSLTRPPGYNVYSTLVTLVSGLQPLSPGARRKGKVSASRRHRAARPNKRSLTLDPPRVSWIRSFRGHPQWALQYATFTVSTARTRTRTRTHRTRTDTDGRRRETATGTGAAGEARAAGAASGAAGTAGAAWAAGAGRGSDSIQRTQPPQRLHLQRTRRAGLGGKQGSSGQRARDGQRLFGEGRWAGAGLGKRAEAEGRWKRVEGGQSAGQQCARAGGGVGGSMDASRVDVLGDSDRSEELDQKRQHEQQHRWNEAQEQAM